MRPDPRPSGWLIATFATLPPLLAGSLGPSAAPTHVVLIGWDGCQRNPLKEMIERKEVPNLMALAQEGRLVDIDVTTGATDTKAGWTQILTGCAPEKTGIFSNARCVFLGTNDRSVHRDGDRMDIAPTILARFGLDLAQLEPSLDGIPLDPPAPRELAPPDPPPALLKQRKAKP